MPTPPATPPAPVPVTGSAPGSNSDWVLDSLNEAFDVRTDAQDKIIEIREHYVVQRHKQAHVSTMPANFDVGLKEPVVTYSVGGISMVKNPPAGGGRFLCVEDGMSPLEHPGDIVVRRQTWETFGRYIPPTPGWLAP